MEKWGLGPSDLSETLVYARISGYGQVKAEHATAGLASPCTLISTPCWIKSGMHTTLTNVVCHELLRQGPKPLCRDMQVSAKALAGFDT